MKTEHELMVSEKTIYGGHPMRVRIARGNRGFGEISLDVHDEQVMRTVSVAALRLILAIYDDLPELPGEVRS